MHKVFKLCGFLFILVLCLVGASVQANLPDATLLYRTTVHSEDVILLENVSYQVTFGSAAQKMRLASSTANMILAQGECEPLDSTEETFVCLVSIQESPPDPIEGTITVHAKSVQANISRMSDLTEVFLGEEMETEVVITNTGEATLDDVVFFDSMAEHMTQIEVHKPCHYSEAEEIITWRGFLEGGGEVSCRYSFSSDAPVDVRNSAVLTYSYKGSTHTRFTPETHYKVTSPVNITVVVPGGNYSLNEKIRSYMTVDNHAEQEMDVELFLVAPEAVQIVSQAFKKEENGFYARRLNLDQDESHLDNLTILGRDDFSGNLYLYGRYQHPGQEVARNISEIRIPISIYRNSTVPDPDFEGVIINVSAVPREVQVGQNFSVDYIVWNKYKNTSLDDLRLYLSIGGTQQDMQAYSRLLPQYGRRSRNQSFIAHHDWPASTNITLAAHYLVGGQPYITSNWTNIKVSKGDNLKLSSSFSPSQPKKGELVTRTVTVANPRNYPIKGITIYEEFSERIEILSGTTRRTMTIPAANNVTAYSYTFIAPSDDVGTVIQTTAQFSTLGNEEKERISSELNATQLQPQLNLSHDFSFSSAWVGDVLPIHYVLSNAQVGEVEHIKGVWNMSGTGLAIQNSEFSLRRLRPTEKLRLPNSIHVISRGNVSLPDLHLSYVRDGQEHVMTVGSNKTLSVSGSHASGPVIDINLTVKNDTANKRFLYSAKIRNTGKIAAVVHIDNLSESVDAGDTVFVNFFRDTDLRKNISIFYQYLN
ncbi:MAG: hypothetical protein ACOCWQ_02070, partial [Nanoarchaeota archaeon]